MPDVKHFDPDAVLESVMRLFWQRGADSTGVSDIVGATGVSRSSLYSTFGGKGDLYTAALRRYVEQRSEPVFRQLSEDERGLAAIENFFGKLIEVRCSGEHARWGCMISNAHATAENTDPDVRAVLQLHHDRLRAAMEAALDRARTAGQLRREIAVEPTADMLATLAYGINLRSRAGATPDALGRTVAATLSSLAK